jgi:hypothetical protein
MESVATGSFFSDDTDATKENTPHHLFMLLLILVV